MKMINRFKELSDKNLDALLQSAEDLLSAMQETEGLFDIEVGLEVLVGQLWDETNRRTGEPVKDSEGE